MISKTLLLTLVIPAIISLLFVLSLKETDKSNIVHEPKLLYLYVPLFGCFLFSFGSFFNIKDYIKNANPNIDNLIFGIFLSILSIICLIMVIYYKKKNNL